MNAAPFPVICLSENGSVTAKNRAAYTYLKSIRMKNSLFPKASFSECGNMMLKDADAPFRYAVSFPVAVGGKTVNILLFLPSAQSGKMFEKDEKIDAKLIFEAIGRGNAAAEPGRVYAEMAEAFSSFDRGCVVNGSTTDVPRVAEILDKKLSSGFRALGYRATVGCTDELAAQKYYKLNLSALVYSVLTAAYVAMRLSRKGTAEVTVDYDERIDFIYVTSRSRTAATMPEGVKCAEDAIAALVPEYAIEMNVEKALSPERMEKKCSIKDGLFTFTIPLKVDTCGTTMSSHASLYSLEDIIGKMFDDFGSGAKATLKRMIYTKV